MYDKWLRRSIALLVLTLFVAACGGGDGSSDANQAGDFSLELAGTLEIVGQDQDKSVGSGVYPYSAMRRHHNI